MRQEVEVREVVRRGQEYSRLGYTEQVSHWQHHAKPSRWPQLLATLSYAEVRPGDWTS